jgi:hypothetical protein
VWLRRTGRDPTSRCGTTTARCWPRAASTAVFLPPARLEALQTRRGPITSPGSTVRVERHSSTAVVLMDSQPVNCLNHACAPTC